MTSPRMRPISRISERSASPAGGSAGGESRRVAMGDRSVILRSPARPSTLRMYRSPSPFSVWQELAVIGKNDAVAVRVGPSLDVQFEINRAHDAIAEHFVDQRLDRRSVHLRHLVQPIDQRIDRYGAVQRALRGDLL